ncbi:MAG: ABC transporter ATP-binding protein [Actinomycetota bacterium]|nr:ABC transporter ATP-binding protein [Actinomycetota bacterium]
MALLEVLDLRVRFDTVDGSVQAVRGVSFSVDAGHTLGIVGESGSGKSVSTQAAFGFARGAHVSGRAMFEGRDLLAMSDRELQAVRGARVGMIFQDPLTSLHPMYRVGWQIVEAIRAHDRSITKRAARSRAVELMGRVGIPQPEQRVDDYPHQFSGGMRQRVMIAMAMALTPSLLIADEPTTALDPTVQAQILELLRELKDDFGTAIIMITHDLGVIAEIADDVVVLYAGKVMEEAAVRNLFYHYHHPYTEGLMASLPSAGVRRGELVPIDGQPPSPIDPLSGCPFSPRCRYAMAECAIQAPTLLEIPGEPRHRSACVLPRDRAARQALAEARRLPATQGMVLDR